MANKMRRPGYATQITPTNHPTWQTHEWERGIDWYEDRAAGMWRYFPPHWQEWMEGVMRDVPWDGGALYMQQHPEMMPPGSARLPPLYPNFPNLTPHPYYNGSGLPGGTKPLSETAITEIIVNKPAAAGTLTTHTSQTLQATAAGHSSIRSRLDNLWSRILRRFNW